MVFNNVYCYPVSSVLVFFFNYLDIIHGSKQCFVLDCMFLKRRDRIKAIGSATGCLCLCIQYFSVFLARKKDRKTSKSVLCGVFWLVSSPLSLELLTKMCMIPEFLYGPDA